ncbi:N-acetylneuraminic acid mutarotase [Mucilaginibacter frigoritolerans]|uniref:N-acetylneuraminic acid mutarotase n=1 Tax=Mucilaginibacter frigoritolerans TaxID=652788 RepID=A0A562UCL4_9SPHI|nr:kelch repeat-containing protein [Mucilaginibacter frigoritolerans]TWJ03600.1 N-acetylneuraminic acid mutarotase [Mucilaginibacter frigoritolerans]
MTLQLPLVSGVSNTTLLPGSTITISGQYFNPALANNQVLLDTAVLSVISVTPTQLVVKGDNVSMSDMGNLTVKTGKDLVTVVQGNYGVYKYLTPKNNFPGPARFGATAVAIGGNIYFGLGKSQVTDYALADWWKYDPNADKWTQLASCPVASYIVNSFSIGTKAYVGMGSGLLFDNSFWCYDTSADTWKQIASFPGTYTIFPVCFSSDKYGYMIGGSQDTPNALTNTNDVWRYNPVTDSWQQTTSFPGLPRGQAMGFTLNNKGYVIGGAAQTGGSDPYIADAWSFDFATETWKQLSMPPQYVARSAGFAFSAQNKGYIGGGLVTDEGGYPYVYEYDPVADSWTLKEKVFAPIKLFSASVSVNGIGYIITGEAYFGWYYAGSQSFFQFKP